MDEVDLSLCIGHSHFAGLREGPMENAGEAVVQDGEDEEGIVQQGQHHLPITITNKNLYEFFSKLKMKTRKKQLSLSSRANTTCRFGHFYSS